MDAPNVLPPNTRRAISSETLDAIKAVPIIDIIGPVVSLRRRGNEFIGLCPFHSEKTPSFTVHPEKNLFYCHGCAAGGDAIAFVKRLDGCDFPTAVEVLARRAGITMKQGVVDRSSIAMLARMKEIDGRIDKIIVAEEIRCADQLQLLRLIARTRSFDTMPSDIYDRLRRADVRYVLVALTSREDALNFLCLSPEDQDKRINQAIDDGFVIGDRRRFYEVPLQ